MHLDLNNFEHKFDKYDFAGAEFVIFVGFVLEPEDPRPRRARSGFRKGCIRLIPQKQVKCNYSRVPRQNGTL